METMPFEFSEILINNVDSFMDDTFHSLEGTANGSGVNVGDISTSVVEAGANISSIVQTQKAKKEALKSDLQKFVDFRCGKNKTRSLNKSKRQDYLVCKQNAEKEYDARSKSADVQNQQRQITTKLAQEKNRQRNTLLIIGGIILVVGYLYFKNKKQA